MSDLKSTLAGVLIWAALAVSVGGVVARAEVAAQPDKAAPAAEPPKPPPAETQPAAPAPTGEPAKPAPAPEPMVQVTGRLIHSWNEKPDLRVILVIDGFTVMTRGEQLTARDGVIWFDEAEARKTGRTLLGIYAETGVEYRQSTGRIERYDSVYLVLETTGPLNLHSDEPQRGKADATELFLRAKKLRREYLESGVRETPTGVVPPPPVPTKLEPPGVREAGIPEEITVVAQDDVRQVNFTSLVEDGMRISIWTGGIYVMRGDMEIAADHVVIWTPEEAVRRMSGSGKTAAEPPPPKAGESQGVAPPPSDEKGAEGKSAEGKAAATSSRRPAAEAYFEGHVRINQGRRMIQASQVYYDFQREQALAIDTKIRTFAETRNVPVYYYAKEVRQLAKGLFVGTDAWMTTCEFAHPHYEMGASKMTLMDLTPPPGEGEEKPEYRRVRFVGEDVQARIRHFPITYWPRLASDFTESETALRTVRIEHRSSRGTGIVSQWHLLKLLGIDQKPPGFDFYLDADFWSERGPAIGVESKYLREDFYGKFLSYYLHDSGKDFFGGERVKPEDAARGRILWQHRQYLPQNWELTLEFSKISDRQFMNEFFEREAETGKAQETLAYLKKQDRDQALTILASARLNDWETQTEYFPQVTYNTIGHSLLRDHLTYFQHSEVAEARYRSAEWRKVFGPNTIYEDKLRAKDSGATLLADTVHEVDLPLKFPPVNVVPFAEARMSYFQEILDRSHDKWRFTGKEGVRAATQAWRVYDNVESDFWDVHRLRHINIFDVSAYTAQCSTASRNLIPFDVTEAGTPIVQGVDSTGVVELGWRQRFETKRGMPANRVNVDWITFDTEATFYDNRITPKIDPDGKRAYNHLNNLAEWKVTDAASLWTDTNFNLESGTLDLFGVGTSITHSPRLSYTIAQRYIPDANSSVTTFGFEYRINEKWQLHVLEQYDFDRQQNAQSDIVLIRRLHRWLLRFRFELDEARKDKFIGIEFQPIGVPEVRFSR